MLIYTNNTWRVKSFAIFWYVKHNSAILDAFAEFVKVTILTGLILSELASIAWSAQPQNPWF